MLNLAELEILPKKDVNRQQICSDYKFVLSNIVSVKELKFITIEI
jgi:hypothetical protein